MNNSFITRMSYKAYLRTQKRADGSSTVVFRVIIDRVKKEFNLNVSWPANAFDHAAGLALPLKRGDRSYESINLVINQANAKAHSIKLYYFAREKELNFDTFIKEFDNQDYRNDFFAYWERKQAELYHGQIVAEGTWERYRISLAGLKEFWGKDVLLMGEMDLDLVVRYNTWLRKVKKLGNNTVCTYLKVFKTFVNKAIKEGMDVENPFKNFKYKFQPGKRSALEMDELARLKKLLTKKTTTPIEHLVLRKFLFSCYTGIRISDSALIKAHMIDSDGVLNLKMKKGERFGKLVQIPLPKFALKMVNDSGDGLFEPVADQTCNNTLKILAGKANIEKNLTFHVSRDTFGTLFIELGGDPVTLKELMGHTNIGTTMIYTKMSEKRKQKLMSNFDNLK